MTNAGWTVSGRVRAVLVLACALALGAVFWRGPGAGLWPSDWVLHVISQCAVAVVACLGYQVLLGQTGVLSLGQGLYAGIGAYAAIYALRHAGLMQALPVALVPLLGAGAGALAALALGRLCARSAGAAPAMISLGLAELAWALAVMLPQLSGGDAGLGANRDWPHQPLGWQWGAPHAVTLLVLSWAALAWVAVGLWVQTPLGRLLGAVRDNPLRVASLGYEPVQLRWLGFAVAGALAGLAGALGALLSERVSPEALAWDKSASVLMFTVLGGSASRAGALMGGVLMATSALVLPLWTPAWPLYLGLAFTGCVAALPGGLVSLAAPEQRARWRSMWQRGAGQRGRWLMSVALGALAVVLAVWSIEGFYAVQRNTELRWKLLNSEQMLTPSGGVLGAALASAGAAWGARWVWRRLGCA